MADDRWIVNNIAIVFIAAPAEKVWRALTDPEMSPNYFMGSRVEVGEVGGTYRIGQDGAWGVTGEVRAKQPARRLRVSWVVEAPPGVTLPNCEVEYLIELAKTPAGGEVVKLTVTEFVDAPPPAQFRRAGAAGWGLITSGLKTFLETGRALPTVRLAPPRV
ncbi:MAG: SRPBCC domain-containing protein [Caulobacteraceae bacterium]|nr:SRPBCC domain-containing protein [Caulobacteraceae bacterium]